MGEPCLTLDLRCTPQPPRNPAARSHPWGARLARNPVGKRIPRTRNCHREGIVFDPTAPAHWLQAGPGSRRRPRSRSPRARSAKSCSTGHAGSALGCRQVVARTYCPTTTQMRCRIHCTARLPSDCGVMPPVWCYRFGSAPPLFRPTYVGCLVLDPRFSRR
jgi:hypothetical protein